LYQRKLGAKRALHATHNAPKSYTYLLTYTGPVSEDLQLQTMLHAKINSHQN